MYTFDSRIRYSETDEYSSLTVPALIDYFQDCSSFQSEDLGIGLSYLKGQNAGWVINYWQVDISRLPRLGEMVRTGTSPYALRGIIGLRNFRMESLAAEEGTKDRILAQANSVWSLLDFEKMLPLRFPEEILRRYTLYPKFDMEYMPRKIAVPSGEGRRASAVAVTEELLDTNHHVNNAVYVRLALRAVERPSSSLRRLQIQYIRQAVLGDLICPAVYGEGTGSICVVLSGENGEPFAVTCLDYREES